MNIFYLDEEPAVACRCLMDVHLRKMIVETCQLLMTTDIMHGKLRPWKPTHIYHPCRLSLEDPNNYVWLSYYLWESCKEYSYRFGKSHACAKYWVMFFATTMPCHTPSFPQCMPEVYRRDNCVEAYKEYYRSKYKEFSGRDIAKYTKREIPEWLLIDV